MISAMLNKDDTNIHVIMNFMRIWKINAEVKIILLGVGVWHGLLTLQWVTMQMPIMATSIARVWGVKALPDFSLPKKPNWCWPNHNYGFEYALWGTTERNKNMQQKIKLLLDAGSLSVCQHHANNDFIIVWLFIATK